MKLLIKNGHLIDPATNTNRKVDILIRNGLFSEIATVINQNQVDRLINAEGLVISPGFIDMHVHLREPGDEDKETIETGSKAAVHGGFTSIATMPNTDPVNDSPSVTNYILFKADETGLVNVFPVAAISQKLEGEELVNMGSLYERGAVGFSDDGRCVMRKELFKQALISAKVFNLPVIEHPEDHSISKNGQIHEGEVSKKLELRGIPSASEEVIVARDIKIQKEVKAKLHLTHISAAGSVNLLKQAKLKKINVTSDVTPHHLLLTDSYLLNSKDTVYKMKPPLRTEKDRGALIEGIKTGIIDCIASDHAPHTTKEKSENFEFAPFGVIGMETSFSLIYDRFVRTGIINMTQVIKLFSTNPAKILNLNERGRVKPGLPADLTILDLDQKFKFKKEDFYSKSINCPFIGWEGMGVVAWTIVGGKVVYKRVKR